MGKRKHDPAFHSETSTHSGYKLFDDSAYDSSLNSVTTQQALPPSPVKKNRPTRVADGRVNDQGLFEPADPFEAPEAPEAPEDTTSHATNLPDAPEATTEEKKKRDRVRAMSLSAVRLC